MGLAVILSFFMAGFVFGVAITVTILRSRVIGDLRIDESDPAQPYIFLELNYGQSIPELREKNFVTLKINPESYIPHE